MEQQKNSPNSIPEVRSPSLAEYPQMFSEGRRAHSHGQCLYEVPLHVLKECPFVPAVAKETHKSLRMELLQNGQHVILATPKTCYFLFAFLGTCMLMGKAGQNSEQRGRNQLYGHLRMRIRGLPDSVMDVDVTVHVPRLCGFCQAHSEFVVRTKLLRLSLRSKVHLNIVGLAHMKG